MGSLMKEKKGVNLFHFIRHQGSYDMCIRKYLHAYECVCVLMEGGA